MKRLLVIAYYFPPMGLSGVQRIAKLVKYLPDFGWAPTVLTTEPGGYFAFDQSLLDDLEHPAISIERTTSPDPTRLFRSRKTVALPAESARSRLSKVSQTLFIPDNKVGWKRPAVKRAEFLHERTPFDAILATAPPYTTALIATQLAKKWKIPVTLDFRDDWIGNPRHYYPTGFHLRMHRRLERRCFNAASLITTINTHIASAIERRLEAYRLASNDGPNVSILNQGFDPADFIPPTGKKANDKRLIFLYTGVFYDAQTPDYFLKALSRAFSTNPEMRNRVSARFIGLLPASSSTLIESLNLQEYVALEGYQTHNKVVEALQEADILWLTVGKGPGQETISTSKLFEYIGARKPIFGLVPDGAAHETLLDYGASFLAEPDNISSIAAQIEQIYSKWEEKSLPKPSMEIVQRYDRREIAAHMASLLRHTLDPKRSG